MKQFIVLLLIVGLLNGCMVKRIFNGAKGQGGGHKSPSTMRR